MPRSFPTHLPGPFLQGGDLGGMPHTPTLIPCTDLAPVPTGEAAKWHILATTGNGKSGWLTCVARVGCSICLSSVSQEEFQPCPPGFVPIDLWRKWAGAASRRLQGMDPSWKKSGMGLCPLGNYNHILCTCLS